MHKYSMLLNCLFSKLPSCNSDGYRYMYLCHKCTDQWSLEASVEKNEIESLDLPQVGKKKTRPNSNRAVTIKQYRVSNF